MWCLGEGAGWWPWFGLLWTLVLGGGLVALVVWGIGRLTRRTDASGSAPGPLDIARERYAKGEIGRAEYEQYRKDLS